MGRNIVRIKETIKKLSDDIQNDVAQTLSRGFYDLEISSSDQNKLDFIHLVDKRVNYFNKTNETPFLTITGQKKNLRELRLATYVDHGPGFCTPAPKDPFALQKSINAYCLLYPAHDVQALDDPFEMLFLKARNYILSDRKNKIAPKPIRPALLNDFCNEVCTILEHCEDFAEEDDIPLSKKDKAELSQKLDVMKMNAKKIYEETAFSKRRSPAYIAATLYGYTIMAGVHFMEDKNVDIEARCFLVEQTGRALHYFANTLK